MLCQRADLAYPGYGGTVRRVRGRGSVGGMLGADGAMTMVRLRVGIMGLELEMRGVMPLGAELHI